MDYFVHIHWNPVKSFFLPWGALWLSDEGRQHLKTLILALLFTGITVIASPGISIPSVYVQCESHMPNTIPPLHSYTSKEILSTEQLSANTVKGVSKNNRTCQITESNTNLPLGPNYLFFLSHYFKFHIHHPLWPLGVRSYIHWL